MRAVIVQPSAPPTAQAPGHTSAPWPLALAGIVLVLALWAFLMEHGDD